MKRDLRFVLISLLFVALFAIVSFGQETTGVIEITAQDPNGAPVVGVAMTVASTGGSTGYRRTVTTNDDGVAKLIQVPPGTYEVTAAAIMGFAEKKLTGIEVGLGRTTSVKFPMTIGTTAVVIVTTDEVPLIDVGSSRGETTISAQTAELLPKGLNFSSILKISPSTRPEPRSGQFQIDGASGSENTFIVDGQEVTNVLSGNLDAGSNIPFSQIQEVQIKSSGFEAEYGGATGGVINVVTKGGGNQFRGEFGVGFRSSKLEPIAGPSLRSNNNQPEYYQNRWNQLNETNPTGNLGGPILKDRLWFFATYAPQIHNQSRTLHFLDSQRVPTGRVETYHFKQRKEAAFARLDGQPFSKLRVTGTINWNPITQTGLIPGYSNELNPQFLGASYYDQTGGRQNSMNYTVSGAYSITSNLLTTARFGHYFLNAKLGSYGIGSIGPPRVTCTSTPFSPAQYPAGFGCVRASPNQTNGVTAIANTEYDATKRDQFDADATYNFGWGGRHEIKGGYLHSKIGNEVIFGQTDLITLRSGSTGLATVGAYAGRVIPTTPGAIGSGRMATFKTRGDVSSTNQGIYIQDKWQPIRRLTLNLGLRTESEDVPSYAPGLPGMSFSWGSKLAPRIGGAYDLTGDGKTKVSGFFGLFYDRFKLTLPRGSFGGDEFHDIFFEWFPGDTINTLNRDTILGPGVAPQPGGACPLNQLAPVYGRVRCDVDFRISSNSGGSLTEVGGIDPNIKPFTQREITFTFQRLLSRNYVVSARYTRKEVLHAIEDAGFPNSQGSEYYIIGNPGEGLYKEQADMFGTLAPKPQRDYDALELRLDRNFADHFFFNANYTFSRLYGNYGGLASSDEEGRSDPNVNRYFDQPHAGYTVAGGPDNGRLATDRPHVFKFYGAYSLGWDQFGLWKNNTTDFEVFTTAASGTVITSFVNINNISQIILTKRGDQGRTPTFTQTDFAMHHTIKFGRDGRFSLKLDADVINVFNQFIVVNKGINPSGQGGNIINTQNFNPLNPTYNLVSAAQTTACNANPSTSQQCLLVAAYQTFQLQGSPELLAAASAPGGTHNPFYNLPSSYQAKRTVRYGIRFLF